MATKSLREKVLDLLPADYNKLQKKLKKDREEIVNILCDLAADEIVDYNEKSGEWFICA